MGLYTLEMGLVQYKHNWYNSGHKCSRPKMFNAVSPPTSGDEPLDGFRGTQFSDPIEDSWKKKGQILSFQFFKNTNLKQRHCSH